ncbi:hypothetical protein BGZ63DRAFT_108491 [Mariannaea sp. PMI_226]|nr:hypothetical protein BGZ63DRAFT_108491 [Mariannaea sp. PMI_226]
MDRLDDLIQLAPSQWCQLFFLLSAGLIIVIQALPKDVRSALMNYGARRPPGADQKQAQSQSQSQTTIWALLAKLTEFGQVPHSWFLHFYIVSVSLSGFWAWQYIQKGSLMRSVVLLQDRNGGPSMELGQVYVAWLLMAMQGLRRLYESLYVSKHGKSPMWVVHWALGLVYYTTMSLSVWIEGSGAIHESWVSLPQGKLLTSSMALPVALYAMAFYKQNQCHQYLASLEKYTLPDDGWFRFIVCPHYTCECLLYLALSRVAAPPGQLFNKSILFGLIFVAVNLGATASGTKKWYAEKFGTDKVANRWCMVPFVF